MSMCKIQNFSFDIYLKIKYTDIKLNNNKNENK